MSYTNMNIIYRISNIQLICLLSYLIVISHGDEIRIGMLASVGKCCSYMSVEHVGSAISLAEDQLRINRVIGTNDTISVILRDTASPSQGVGNVVDLVMKEDVDVIFGSASSGITIPSALLTSFWNFPHVTWAANSFELSYKNVFTTLVRAQGPLSEVGSIVVTLCETFSWKHVGMLYIDDGLCNICAAGIKKEIAEHNVTLTKSIAYHPSTIITNDDIDNYLKQMKETSRIIFICVDDELRRFMVRACKFEMCNGEFLFIYTTRFDPIGAMWSNGDTEDYYAKLAYKYLMLITKADWLGEEGKIRLDTFKIDVIERMSEPPWNSNDAKLNNISASEDALYLYDAMYFYGLWRNHSKTVGINVRNGSAMLAYSKGISFEGLSGPCDIGDNADRLPYFWIYEFLGAERLPQIVATAQTKHKVLTAISGGFQWFTADGKPPKDIPDCGFQQERCLVVKTDNTVVVIVSCVSVLAVGAVAAIVGFIIRNRQIENTMMKSIWKINIEDIELQKSPLGLGSMKNFNKTAASQSLSNISAETNVALLTTVGLFKGQMIFIRNIRKDNPNLTREGLIELKTMREMMHDNINPFIGACFDTASPCVLFIYCPKGSLQDILENDDIKLDISFKYSLMMDLVQGIYYLHTSKIGSHGRLKSTNCLVDSRWVLKITDYGLGKFIDNELPRSIDEHEMFKSLLWTAPELLAKPGLYPAGTKNGDIYSLSIILHEILYRMGPFAGKEHMTAKDIISHVKNREIPPCRPAIFCYVTDISPSIVKLMQLCWDDNESERPSVSVIRSYIKKNIPGITTNIMDIVLHRLEKYASNLENLVDQRTEQLMQEKQKMDRLLCRMLPPSCAEKLKQGEPIHPEIFEAATVFFSDIVGFTTIASKSTPIEVVDFLNDLYTCFDSIIAMHDAYKVETIGDAYLVVSGIPHRNGILHAGIIAEMALDIQDGVGQFKIKHMPQEKLRVRIGIHTGSCCAGVVGLSMPRYCLFGDTVNTASRMESNGESQRIHVSEAAVKALQELGGFRTVLRGEMPIKGKGMMTTYWLLGKEDRMPKGIID